MTLLSEMHTQPAALRRASLHEKLGRTGPIDRHLPWKAAQTLFEQSSDAG
jgi:hypothetical protein